MPNYRVEVPDASGEGLRVSCEAHGTSETFRPGVSRAHFYCPECELELGVLVEDTDDWRELTELC